MKSIFFIVSIIVSTFFFSNCTEGSFSQVVEIDLPEHQKTLAVSGTLTNLDSLSTIVVSHTWGTLEKPPTEGIKDATVRLLKDGSLIREFLPTQAGYFYESLAIKPWQPDGGVYTLEVSAPGFEDVYAEQIIPKEVPIINGTYTADGAVTPDGEKEDEITIEFQDEVGVDDYYGIRAYFEMSYYDQAADTTYTFLYDIYLESFDPLVEQGEGNMLLLHDAAYDGKKISVRTYHYNGVSDPENTKVVVHLVHLTKDNYLLLKSLRQYYDAADNPFAEPVTVQGNVKNGAGGFTMATVSSYEIEF